MMEKETEKYALFISIVDRAGYIDIDDMARNGFCLEEIKKFCDKLYHDREIKHQKTLEQMIKTYKNSN